MCQDGAQKGSRKRCGLAQRLRILNAARRLGASVRSQHDSARLSVDDARAFKNEIIPAMCTRKWRGVRCAVFLVALLARSASSEESDGEMAGTSARELDPDSSDGVCRVVSVKGMTTDWVLEGHYHITSSGLCQSCRNWEHTSQPLMIAKTKDGLWYEPTPWSRCPHEHSVISLACGWQVHIRGWVPDWESGWASRLLLAPRVR